jgi:hypothetical protein
MPSWGAYRVAWNSKEGSSDRLSARASQVGYGYGLASRRARQWLMGQQWTAKPRYGNEICQDGLMAIKHSHGYCCRGMQTNARPTKRACTSASYSVPRRDVGTNSEGAQPAKKQPGLLRECQLTVRMDGISDAAVLVEGCFEIDVGYDGIEGYRSLLTCTRPSEDRTTVAQVASGSATACAEEAVQIWASLLGCDRRMKLQGRRSREAWTICLDRMRPELRRCGERGEGWGGINSATEMTSQRGTLDP